MPSRRKDPRHELGRRGEKLAARFLRKQGYKVLHHGFRARGGGEVDIVCRHHDTLVFVEVKTRTGLAYGRPSEAVDTAKQKLITRGASAWLRMLPETEILYRFDIVEILVGPDGIASCEVIANAFTPPDRELR